MSLAGLKVWKVGLRLGIRGRDMEVVVVVVVCGGGSHGWRMAGGNMLGKERGGSYIE